MAKFWAIILCMCYNLVSVGATLQIHTCGSNVLWSISETEPSDTHCPLCAHTSVNSCHGDACENVELKLDQLSDKLFANSQDTIHVVQTAIITLPWIIPLQKIIPAQIANKAQVLTSSDSSPPIYILNCTYRI